MSSRGSSAGFDRHLTIFSPEGRLYQVEYAFKAVNRANINAVGVKGNDIACVAIQKKVPDKLVVEESHTNVYAISPKIGCAMVGLAPDARFQVIRAVDEAGKHKYNYGLEPTVEDLARIMADINQKHTASPNYGRPLGCVIILIGFDDENGQVQLYRVDPAGDYRSCNGLAVGPKQQMASSYLEKKLNPYLEKLDQLTGADENARAKIFKDLTYEKTVQLCLDSLQNAVGIDFKASEVQVVVVSADEQVFKELDKEEIERHLQALAERDD